MGVTLCSVVPPLRSSSQRAHPVFPSCVGNPSPPSCEASSLLVPPRFCPGHSIHGSFQEWAGELKTLMHRNTQRSPFNTGVDLLLAKPYFLGCPQSHGSLQPFFFSGLLLLWSASKSWSGEEELRRPTWTLGAPLPQPGSKQGGSGIFLLFEGPTAIWGTGLSIRRPRQERSRERGSIIWLLDSYTTYFSEGKRKEKDKSISRSQSAFWR